MASRRRPSSLADLPTELAIRIAGHVAATSVQPMEDLRALWVICHFIHHVRRDPEVGRLISIERFDMYWDDPDGFLTLLPRLAQVRTLVACFIIGMTVVLCESVIRPLLVVDENLKCRPPVHVQWRCRHRQYC